MELLYKSEYVDILFDKNSNLIIQRWKDKRVKSGQLFFNENPEEGVADRLFEIAKYEIYRDPVEEMEIELQLIMLQWQPLNNALA
jgi:hypothetical protein